jgi:ketosteroid isomerase-like protein
MKTSIYSILMVTLLIIASNLSNAQTQIAAGSKTYSIFLQNLETWQSAYNSGDAQNLVPLYAEDATYSSSHVAGLEAIGRDKLIANFQNGMKMGGHIDKIEILSANVSKDMASLYCKYQVTNSGVTVSGRNLLVLRKVKGKWIIISHMTVV